MPTPEFFESLLATLDPILLLSRLSKNLPESRLEFSLEQEPEPMDTLGTLVDKLITVDMKMWHNQEHLYAIRRMTADEFVERYGNSLAEVHTIIKRCCDLNVQRARVIDAIDAYLQRIVDGHLPQVNLSHKTY